MTTYNIVGASSLVAGQPEDVSQVLANFQAIQAILNGGIDNTNINVAAAIAYSKLALTGSIVNGDINAAAAIALSKLAAGPNHSLVISGASALGSLGLGTVGQVLRSAGAGADPTWGSLPSFTVNATPPGSPVDGDYWIFPADAANGVYWTFVYVSAEPTYKWRFAGGSPMFSEVITAEGNTSTSYVALATAGPIIALTRDGDYDVQHGFEGQSAASQNAFMSYDIGGTPASDNDATRMASLSSSTALLSASRRRRKTAIGAAVTLTAKYRNSTGSNAGFQNRWMAVTPVRVI